MDEGLFICDGVDTVSYYIGREKLLEFPAVSYFDLCYRYTDGKVSFSNQSEKKDILLSSLLSQFLMPNDSEFSKKQKPCIFYSQGMGDPFAARFLGGQKGHVLSFWQFPESADLSLANLCAEISGMKFGPYEDLLTKLISYVENGYLTAVFDWKTQDTLVIARRDLDFLDKVRKICESSEININVVDDSQKMPCW